MTFSLRKLLFATACIAVLFSCAIAIDRSIIGRSRVADRIATRIEAMSAAKPANLTAQQWQILVDWTRNLHGNSLLQFQTTASQIRVFESRLNDRLDQSVDADTIEWIWDEYANACDGGRKYQRFRLMVNESLVSCNSPVLLAYPHDP